MPAPRFTGIDDVPLPGDPLHDLIEEKKHTWTPIQRVFRDKIACAIYLTLRVNVLAVGTRELQRPEIIAARYCALKLSKRVKNDPDVLWRASPGWPTWPLLFALEVTEHQIFGPQPDQQKLQALAEHCHPYVTGRRFAYHWETPSSPMGPLRRNHRIEWKTEDLTQYRFHGDGTVTTLDGVPVGTWETETTDEDAHSPWTW